MARPFVTRQEVQESGIDDIIQNKCKEMFHKVLVWGTPSKTANQSFIAYLLCTKGMAVDVLNKEFAKDLQDLMNKDPGMSSFDLSLLYKCLRCGTDKLAPPNDKKWYNENTLEGKLTAVKNHRNDLAHKAYKIDDKMFSGKIKVLKDLITSIIKEAARRFGKVLSAEADDLSKKFSEDLDKIKDRATSASRLDFEGMCKLLKDKGTVELKGRYKTQTTMSPIFNLLGRNILVDVKQIFTKLVIQKGNCKQLLPVHELFEYVNKLNSTHSVLFVTGVAGVGKTTLTRMILQEWSKDSSGMKNIDTYDFTIWTECRDSRTETLACLLQSLMPNTTHQIPEDVRVRCIQNKNKLLFVVDGLDELNPSSKRVFSEILKLDNTDSITIICTTRPNKVYDVAQYVPPNFKIEYVEIIGIAETDREDFVKSYTKVLGKTEHNPEILSYLKRYDSLQEHWKIPFNLVLLTVLWVEKPTSLNEMTTATELFLKTYELCRERLLQKLKDNQATKTISRKDLEESLNFVVKVMANVAFASHCNDETILSQTSLDRLKEACHRKTLPPEKIIGSFLVQTVSIINKNLEKVSFPHKGLQDFFCALHIVKFMERDNTNLNIPKILSSFQQILLENNTRIPNILQVCSEELYKSQRRTSSHTVRSVFKEALNEVALTNPNQDKQLDLDLPKWRNVLMHLMGLLHQGGLLTEERAEEMVKLLEESGITVSDEWFYFLSNVKGDAVISKYIILRGSIKVTDARVEPFLKVLDHAVPDDVTLEIGRDPSSIHRLQELLVALGKKDWSVTLILKRNFRFPMEGSILDGTLFDLFQ